MLEGSEAISDYLNMLDTWYSDNKEDISEKDYNTFLMKMSDAQTTWPRNVSHVVLIWMNWQEASPGKMLPEWEELSAVAMSVQNLHLALTTMECAGGFWSSHTFCKQARDSQMMKDFVGSKNKDDRVLGAFIMGKVEAEQKFKGSRRDWREKVTWK